MHILRAKQFNADNYKRSSTHNTPMGHKFQAAFPLYQTSCKSSILNVRLESCSMYLSCFIIQFDLFRPRYIQEVQTDSKVIFNHGGLWVLWSWSVTVMCPQIHLLSVVLALIWHSFVGYILTATRSMNWTFLRSGATGLLPPDQSVWTIAAVTNRLIVVALVIRHIIHSWTDKEGSVPDYSCLIVFFGTSTLLMI